MMKPLLTLIGKFVPGVNTLAWGYTIYQMGEVGLKMIGAIKGTPEHVPIPIVSGGSLWNPTNVISGLATGGSVMSTAYQWVNGSPVERKLKNYKGEMSGRIATLEKGLADNKESLERELVVLGTEKV